MIDVPAIRDEIAVSVFGGPLLQNTYRGVFVEHLIAAALGNSWRLAGADWLSWDIESDDGLRLEVKNSAAKQSWHEDGAAPSPATFDIASRTGRWEGTQWVATPGRAADLYVFARHPVFDESADHTSPTQWRFYVVTTSKLPDQKKISLRPLENLARSVGIEELADEVEAVAVKVRTAAAR